MPAVYNLIIQLYQSSTATPSLESKRLHDLSYCTTDGVKYPQNIFERLPETPKFWSGEIYNPDQSEFPSLTSAFESARLDDSQNVAPARPDFRFGLITCDWVDMESADAVAKFSPFPNLSTGSSTLSLGVIHLFKQAEPPPTNDTDEWSNSQKAGDGTILAILFLPGYMTTQNFLEFCKPALDAMSHIRLLRDEMDPRSIALIKFKTAAEASEFGFLYHGRAFSALNPSLTCRVVRIASVEVTCAALASFSMPILPLDDSSKHQALPSCPICLDRMDSSITGLITLLCQHSAHCKCLAQVVDSRCPVCRYSNPRQRAVKLKPGEGTCAKCDLSNDLWICCICGVIGCGRYASGHAVDHWKATGHAFALELGTQRVWDYSGDNYVHRILLDQDGSHVELPSLANSRRAGSRDGPNADDIAKVEKIEQMGLEFSIMLTTQLDSQRAYFEEERENLTEKLNNLEKATLRDEQRVRDLQEQLLELNNQKKDFELNVIPKLKLERDQADSKAKTAAKLLQKLQSDLSSERSVAQGLHEKIQSKLKSEAESTAARKELEEKVQGLEEQCKDLMFFLESRATIESEGGAELRGGDLQISQNASSSNSKSKRKKKP